MSNLKFLDYKVVEAHFKANTDIPQGPQNFQISPKIRFDIHHADKNLTLKVNVNIDKSQPTPTPFELNIDIVGHFLVERPTDINSLRIEATSVLFPYVRAAVSGLTVNANLPAYVLPLINFAMPMGGSVDAAKKPESVIIKPLQENF